MIKQFVRPLLSVRPLRCMLDERFDVRVQYLLPGVRLTLHALLHSEDGDFWEAFGHYVSDETGNIRVSTDMSVGGSYRGVEAMGLLWSMKPVPGSRTGLSHVKKCRYDREQRHIWRDTLLPIPDDRLSKVEVDRIKCPILLIVGEDDQSSPTSESAEDMKLMMERGGNSHLLTVLSYPRAGHLIEPPYSPHCQASNFIPAETRTKVMVLWGGQTQAHSQAQEDSWQKILAFLEQNFYNTIN